MIKKFAQRFLWDRFHYETGIINWKNTHASFN